MKSEGSAFNERLWQFAFKEIYRGNPGPARQIESVRFLATDVAIVQARANHVEGVTLEDGTRIPPFWEIDTYTVLKTETGWKVCLLNIHNQIDPGSEKVGEHLPNASGALTAARLQTCARQGRLVRWPTFEEDDKRTASQFGSFDA